MTTLTLAQASSVTIGDLTCLMLTYDHDNGDRTAHIIPEGTITHRTTEYGTTNPDTLIDLILYEPHMPSPDMTTGLTGRLTQLADTQATITITIPNPALLDPLRTELATIAQQQEEAA